MSTRQFPRARLGLVGAVVLAVLSGCPGPNTGTLEGNVSLDGEAITFGTVAVLGADGRVDSAMIRSDGTYTLEKAPVGDVVITVQTYPLPPQVQPPDAPGGGKPSALRYVPIPDRYGDVQRSPLRWTVQPGRQTFNLDLTRKSR
jgi:hypothetical protein